MALACCESSVVVCSSFIVLGDALFPAAADVVVDERKRIVDVCCGCCIIISAVLFFSRMSVCFLQNQKSNSLLILREFARCRRSLAPFCDAVCQRFDTPMLILARSWCCMASCVKLGCSACLASLLPPRNWVWETSRWIPKNSSFLGVNVSVPFSEIQTSEKKIPITKPKTTNPHTAEHNNQPPTNHHTTPPKHIDYQQPQ